MRLIELDATFVKLANDQGTAFNVGVPMAEADGVMFECPGCRGHSLLLWFKGKVANDVTPGPGRWEPRGTGIDDLWLFPSVDLSRRLQDETEASHAHPSRCKWHGWIQNGEAK